MFAVLWKHRETAPAWRQLALVEVAGTVITDLVLLYELYISRQVASDAKVEKKSV